MKKTILAFLLFGAVLSLFSCEADDNDDDASIFLGRWKTNYGDTVIFSRQNGKNIVRYNESMNPGMPMISNHEYQYTDGKFSLNRSPGSGNDYFWDIS